MARANHAPEDKLLPWDEAWDAFVNSTTHAAVTRRNLGSYAKQIDRFRAKHGITDPNQFTDALENKFLDEFEVLITRWTYQKTLKSFFRWCLTAEHPWRQRKSGTDWIDTTELDEPLEQVDLPMLVKLKAKASPRDRALLDFIYHMAARAGEARNAKLQNYHRSQHTMLIELSKQGRRRTMPLPESAVRELNHYINHVRPKQVLKLKSRSERSENEGNNPPPETAQPWLFLTTTRERGEYGDYRQLSESGLASIFRRLRLELDIETGKLSPQLLRRGRATELAGKYPDTVWLMHILGWKDVRSIRRYLVQSLEKDRQMIEELDRDHVD